MYQSPLNYTGGKYRLLPQILPELPRQAGTFVDLFCGGCSVGLNASCERVVYNDANHELLALLGALHAHERRDVLGAVYEIIAEYGLSLSSRDGYAHYGCESNAGLGSYNKVPYLRLRDDFNAQRPMDGAADFRRLMTLYVLTVYSFNNQIRFNAQGEFNMPVGKRDFSKAMEAKLSGFIDRVQAQDCTFACRDFRAFDPSTLTSSDFVFADPPYLITRAPYNEQNGWTEKDEIDLLEFLDVLTARGIPFALSNVLASKGAENLILKSWLRKNASRYRAVPLISTYANASYQIKDRSAKAEEVLIRNY